MQNIRMKEGIESRAKEYIEKNPRCFVALEKEPQKLFNEKEMDVYGREHLKPVVTKIHELLTAANQQPPQSMALGNINGDHALPYRSPQNFQDMRRQFFTPQDVRSDGPVGPDRTVVSQVSTGSHVDRMSHRKLWIGGFPTDYEFEDVRGHLDKWRHSLVAVGHLQESKGFGARPSRYINIWLVIFVIRGHSLEPVQGC